MKQFKKLKRVWALMLALVMMLSVLPAETAWAADKYELKRGCAKNTVTVVGEGCYLCVSVYKNGKDVTSKAGRVKWKISDESVVTFGDIWGDGVQLQAKKKGTATVTATYKEQSCSFKVTVKDVMISYVSYDNNEKYEDGYLMAGQSVEIYVRGEGWDDSGKTGSIRYSSSDKSVVKIVGNGYEGKKIKGLKEGTATITAKSKLGTAKCTVKVLPAMKLRVKNCRDVKKNGAVIGYSCNITNNGKKTVVFENGVKHEEEGGMPYYEPIQGKTVSIKPGQTKTVTVFTRDGRGLFGGAGYRMKYLGHYVCADIGEGNTKLDYFRVVTI